MDISTIQKITKKRQKAAELRRDGKTNKAIELLRSACLKWPNNPAFIADLASAYSEVSDFKQSEKCLHKMLELSPGDPETLRFVADMRYSMRRIDSALSNYKELTAALPSTKALGSQLKTVEILERQGRLDEAQETLERALKLDPKSEHGRFLHAVLKFRSAKFEDAEQELCDLLGSGLQDREIHWKAGHQLATVLDKKGEHQDAALVLQASKAGMENDYAKEIKMSRDAFRLKSQSIKQLTSQLTRADIERWRAENEDTFPAAVLAGHPRSGTTLLESILDRHSGVVSVEETTCMEDEIFRSVFGVAAAKPELFDIDFLNQVPKSSRMQARKSYLKSARQFLVNPPDSNQLILDKNPMLTHFLAVGLRFFPQMKSIVALRDPRDICLSCYQQPVGVMTSNVSWLRVEDTMNAYNDIMGVWLRLKEILPDGWIEVRYEDLVTNTETVAKQVVDFLELPWEEDILVVPDRGRTIFSPTYADAAKPVYRSAMRRWESYEELLAPHLSILQPSIDALGY